MWGHSQNKGLGWYDIIKFDFEFWIFLQPMGFTHHKTWNDGYHEPKHKKLHTIFLSVIRLFLIVVYFHPLFLKHFKKWNVHCDGFFVLLNAPQFSFGFFSCDTHQTSWNFEKIELTQVFMLDKTYGHSLYQSKGSHVEKIKSTFSYTLHGLYSKLTHNLKLYLHT